MGDKITRNVQEYLETLYVLKRNGEVISVREIADYLKVAPSSVTEMLKKLAEMGYVLYSPYHGATLTDAGLKLGAKMSRKHRLLERFLHDVLKLGGERVHQEACEIEHALSDEAEVALCQFLGHPDKCPHDQPIQPCDMPFASCEECMKSRVKGMEHVGKRNENLVSIADLKEHEEGKVVFIRGDSKVLRRLLDMGITTSTTVHIIKVAPFGGPVEVAVRGSKLALGRDIASDVFIEKIANELNGQ